MFCSTGVSRGLSPEIAFIGQLVAVRFDELAVRKNEEQEGIPVL
jgi:hypothetical protein